MKKYLLIAVALTLCTTLFADEMTPAFPGAEGHGRFVSGGRGGKIIHVTNLNDSGEGSLRWAMSQSGPKTIVFDVSGYIDLKSQLNVSSNTTIAGQTAPGGGITLRYYTLYLGQCDNVIVRFIRSRRSQVKDVNDGADATWGRRRKGIILDHCSFSWSIDDVASFYDNCKFTMQWCTIGEGLANPGHSKAAHSYGGLWGGKEVSFHHNYITHVQNHAPRFNGARYEWDGWDKDRFESTVDAERVDFRNNVLYNWGNGNGSHGGHGGGYINIVHNYYQAGPGTTDKTNVTQVSIGDAKTSTNEALHGLCSRYFIEGNYVTAANQPEYYDWKGVKYDSGLISQNGEMYMADPMHRYGESVEYIQIDEKDHVRVRLDKSIDAGTVTTHSAKTAYNKILSFCGASLYRDGVDVRYMEEARTGTVTYLGNEPLIDENGKIYPTSNTAGILDFINDPDKDENPKTASFPPLPSIMRPEGFDTDLDGIPDEWEIANDLNPEDDRDANLYTIDSKRIYTNVEVYLNSLVEHIMKAGNADAIDAVDEYYPKYVGIQKVAAPIISHSLESMKAFISCPTAGAHIRYSIDGSIPTDSTGMEYVGPIGITSNITFTARAFLENYLDSDVTVYGIGAVKYPAPEINFENGMVSINCATADAEIHYTVDDENLSAESPLYSEPFALDRNAVIRAFALIPGLDIEPSDVTVYVVDIHSVDAVRISYNGRYVSMATDDSDATILYSTDGSEPSEEYTGEFDAEGLRTLRAMAVKTDSKDSEVTELVITRYADEEHAETAEEGLLASAFDWDETGLANNVETFRIQGCLNDADYAFVRSMGALRYLDIEAVDDAHIPEYAFANIGLISVSLPEDLAACGDSILSGADRLGSVVWNSRTVDVNAGLTRSLANNPNLLLYVPEGVGVENPGGLHVVRDGRIPSLTLSYGHPYYAARNFTADRVSLTHEFLQPTEIGVCQGWETLVLPFSPTEITHEVNGPAAPFGSYAGGVDARRFWLYRANAGGWTASTSIRACVPYVISMPNSPDYVREFNLGGRVTFSATDVELGPDGGFAEADPWVNGTRFEGTFMPVESAGILSLNVDSAEGGYRPGSTFVPDGVTLPFGAYVSGAGRKAMSLFGDSNGVDLPQVADDGLLVETPAPGMLRISSGRELKVTVTTVTGVTLRTLHLKPGEAQTLEGLTHDLYIVADRKVMVR